MTPVYQEPVGLNWGHFTNSEGADIRYASLKPEGEARGRIVLLPGFRESIEKYFEAAEEFRAKGLEVWMMDWRGQGGSERYLPNPEKAHHEGYDEQIKTLHQLTQKVIPQDGKPLMMLAHSMGGHLGLRYAQEHPGVFDSLMLTAPMIDIVTGPLPVTLARQIAKFAKAGNYLDKYVPGGCDWTESRNQFAGNDKTSDPKRFQEWVDFCKAGGAGRIGDPTYGWVYHTFKSIDILSDESYLKSIRTPVLMATSGKDTIVSVKAQDRAEKLLPNCRRVHIADAKHEIMHERDELRKQWMSRVFDFIDERLAPTAPAIKKPKPHMVARRPKM